MSTFNQPEAVNNTCSCRVALTNPTRSRSSAHLRTTLLSLYDFEAGESHALLLQLLLILALCQSLGLQLAEHAGPQLGGTPLEAVCAAVELFAQAHQAGGPPSLIPLSSRILSSWSPAQHKAILSTHGQLNAWPVFLKPCWSIQGKPEPSNATPAAVKYIAPATQAAQHPLKTAQRVVKAVLSTHRKLSAWPVLLEPDLVAKRDSWSNCLGCCWTACASSQGRQPTNPTPLGIQDHHVGRPPQHGTGQCCKPWRAFARQVVLVNTGQAWPSNATPAAVKDINTTRQAAQQLLSSICYHHASLFTVLGTSSACVECSAQAWWALMMHLSCAYHGCPFECCPCPQPFFQIASSCSIRTCMQAMIPCTAQPPRPSLSVACSTPSFSCLAADATRWP